MSESFLPDFNYESIQKYRETEKETVEKNIKEEFEKEMRCIQHTVMVAIGKGETFASFQLSVHISTRAGQMIINELIDRFPGRLGVIFPDFGFKIIEKKATRIRLYGAKYGINLQ
jgi:hypothetical protein